MEIECRKRVDKVRKELEVKNGELMGESLQTRMKVKTAEWAKQQLENHLAKEEVDCLITLMIDCTCEKNHHLNIKVSDN